MNIKILGRTGPRSKKGKAISAMNAVKHGAYAKKHVLPHECEIEYRRILRELIKSFKPQYPVEKQQISEMADTLWSIERHKLKLMYRQEAIFKELSPKQLAEMIGAYEEFVQYAPEWLKQPNTKFSARELKDVREVWQEYIHLLRNNQGLTNYNNFFNACQKLFESLHTYMDENHHLTLIAPGTKALALDWQNSPAKLNRYLNEYGALIYFKLKFEEFKPKIRLAMSSWFFLERVSRKETDYQDEGVLRELRRYQNLQDSYFRMQKSFYLRDLALEDLKRKTQDMRNEIPKNDCGSVT